MIEELKSNLEQEKKILSSIKPILYNLREGDRSFYTPSVNAMVGQLRILNNSIPGILNEISPVKSLSEKKIEIKPEIVKLSYISPITKEKVYIAINKNEKSSFVKELQVSDSGLSNIKKIDKERSAISLNKPSSLAIVSSKLFSRVSDRLTPKFSGISEDLKKANIRFLLSTYLSIAIFVSLLAFLAGLAGFIILLTLDLSYFIYFWIPFLLCLISITGFYFYPASEKNSVQKKVSQELPFATIHMAAIAGSNIEPTKIFKIIANSSEYPTIGMEIRKVINQTDVYGYDLVTALKNSSKQTSNSKLSELFNGLATNISSGGNLKLYLEKKSENFLTDYRLERQSYNDLAGTFMDIYISILITAPMILMMMFIVMNLSGLKLGGLSLDTLLILSVVGVVLINILFIIALEVKQPKG